MTSTASSITAAERQALAGIQQAMAQLALVQGVMAQLLNAKYSLVAADVINPTTGVISRRMKHAPFFTTTGSPSHVATGSPSHVTGSPSHVLPSLHTPH